MSVTEEERDPWLEFIEFARPAFDAEHTMGISHALAAGEELEALGYALQAVVLFGGVEVPAEMVAELRDSLWDDPERFEIVHVYIDELDRRAVGLAPNYRPLGPRYPGEVEL